MSLEEEKIKILKAIEELGGIAKCKDIAERIGMSVQKVAAHIRAIKNKGYVEQIKKGEYRLTEAGKKVLAGE